MRFSVIDDIYENCPPSYSSDEDIDVESVDEAPKPKPKPKPTTESSNSRKQQNSPPKDLTPRNSSQNHHKRNYSPPKRREPRRTPPRSNEVTPERRDHLHSRDNRNFRSQRIPIEHNEPPRHRYPNPRDQRHSDYNYSHGNDYQRPRPPRDSPRIYDSRTNIHSNYNPMDQLQSSKTDDRYQHYQQKFSQRQQRHPSPRTTIQKPKFYQKREITVLGASTNAPTKVTQPIKTDFGPLKDWRTFTLETNSDTFFDLLDKVRDFARNHPKLKELVFHRPSPLRTSVDRLAQRNSNSPQNTKQQKVQIPDTVEFYLIYGDERKLQTANETDKRWRMPQGPVEQALNQAYNEADLVFIFFSDRCIVGCACVVSAIGFQRSEALPGCQLSDICEYSISFDDIRNFSTSDLIDGKKLSDQVGRDICSRSGLNLDRFNNNKRRNQSYEASDVARARNQNRNYDRSRTRPY